MSNRNFWIFFILLCSLLGAEYGYLKSKRSLTKKEIALKNEIVKFGKIVDFAVSTETRAIRYRSEIDVFSVFNESPELLDYFPTTFVYAPSNVLRKTPSRIEVE